MERLPSLNAVRSFVAAARLQSFTAAAQELHVTQGAVSRMVQALEQELGLQLFNRNGRFIALTQAGQGYYEEVSHALDLIATASRKIQQAERAQALQLVVNSAFAIRWLMPRLPAFQRKHPSIDVHILSSEAESGTHAETSQLTIRYGKGNWPGISAEALPLGTLMGVVCSPELKATKTLNSPSDLLGRPLLTHTANADTSFWAEYFTHYGLTQPNLDLAPRFHQLLLLAEAAMGGLGFALVPLFLFQAELNAGRLVLAVNQTFTSARGYFVTHASGAAHDYKVRVFKQWLMRETHDCHQQTEAIWQTA